jgi:Peptidase family M1 domain/TPR repeat
MHVVRMDAVMRKPGSPSVRNASHGAAVCACLLLGCAAAWGQAPMQPPVAAETTQQTGFRAVSYDVFASLSPADQTLTGKATVEFESSAPSRTVECELHPNLQITGVQDADGQSLAFTRDAANPLQVRVALLNPVAAGASVKLTFEYSGPLASEENTPVHGVRLAWIGSTGAYLLLPARWFPLTGYPSNRYTGVFRIEVPQNFTVVGTGTAEAPSTVPSAPAGGASFGGSPEPAGGPGSTDNGAPVLRHRTGPGPSQAAESAQTTTPIPGAGPRNLYTFHVDKPEAAGTFVAGTLQMFPMHAQGLDMSVYAPPSAGGAAQDYADAVARMVEVFSDQFGPLAQPNLTVAQLPDGSVSSFAAPGLLLVSHREWLATPDTRLLSDLVAEQWWGNQVMAASPSDTWITDGLARYSEAIYMEQTAGKGGRDRVLDQFAVGALMYESAAPIAQAGRLQPFTPDYTSVVVNKGAMVFHMLRMQLGDAAFFPLLRDFFTQYSGKTATVADFEKMAEARAAQLASTKGASSSGSSGFVLRPDSGSAAAPSVPSNESSGINLHPFFAQWLNSTGVPQFSLDYTVYRIKNGFKVVGKVKQNLDFFNMPVEMEVETEGNPEFKTIQVTGTESTFDIDTFGRPKAGGIILDPHNYILKSSPQLHVRAIIARGESFAEQGRYYDAVQQYAQALDLDHNNALANFRMGEAFFYQKNYSAAANAFRDALDGTIDLNTKWIVVWAHIYLGKIYDLSGDRVRAVNEYSKAQQTSDNTDGAQAEAKKYLAHPFSEGAASTSPGN